MLLVVLMVSISAVWAVPAHPRQVRVQQPDGTYVTIRQVGDEWRHFTITADGYSVVKDNRGYYVYAEERNGLLEPTTLVAHDAAVRTAQEKTFLSAIAKCQAPAETAVVRQKRQLVEQGRRRAAARHRSAQYDYTKFKGLIILVEYKDKSFSRSDYGELMDNMVNQEGFTGYDSENGKRRVMTGSVRDYFSDNSDSKFQPHFDVAGPYKINYSQYYAHGTDNTSPLINAAINAADADVDFSQYDGDNDGVVDLVYFIFAGNSANYSGNDSRLLWPHRYYVFGDGWDYYNYKDGVQLWDYACSLELAGWTDTPESVDIDGIGTICHEFSHVLGLPDFYDTNYATDGMPESITPGDWSVMDGGCYLNDGITPAGYSLYERYDVGFMDVPEKIQTSGNYTLEPVSSSYKGFRIDSQVNNEFFLFENRQTSFKWDAYLPGSGMLVYRVDKTNQSVWDSNDINDNPYRNYYELVRANGSQEDWDGKHYDSELDAFPNGGVTELSSTTSPAKLQSHDGKGVKWVLSNIEMKDGVVTFHASDGNELTSLSVTETATVAVGMSVQLSAVATPATADFTLTWSSADETVATVDQNGLVTGVAEGTTVITVESDNGLTATCQVTVKEPTPISVAEFKQTPVGEEVVLKLEHAEVLYVQEEKIGTAREGAQSITTYYVRDATGAVMFYNTGLDLAKNDILDGTVHVKVGVRNGLTRVMGVKDKTNAGRLTITPGEEVVPREVKMDELCEADYSDLVVLRCVQVTNDEQTGVWAVDGAAQLCLTNPFRLDEVPASLDGKRFDVEGIYGVGNVGGELVNQLYRTKEIVEVEDPDNPTGIRNVNVNGNDNGNVNVPRNATLSKREWTTLTGQRVNVLKKGVLIHNGRKVVVK